MLPSSGVALLHHGKKNERREQNPERLCDFLMQLFCASTRRGRGVGQLAENRRRDQGAAAGAAIIRFRRQRVARCRLHAHDGGSLALALLSSRLVYGGGTMYGW